MQPLGRGGALKKVPDVLSVYVDLFAAEVTVEARAGKVKAEKLVEVVNRTQDSSHSFKAKLKEVKKKKKPG